MPLPERKYSYLPSLIPSLAHCTSLCVAYGKHLKAKLSVSYKYPKLVLPKDSIREKDPLFFKPPKVEKNALLKFIARKGICLRKAQRESFSLNNKLSWRTK